MVQKKRVPAAVFRPVDHLQKTNSAQMGWQ